MPDLTSTSLNAIYGSIAPAMTTSESELKTLLGNIPSGGDITTAQLLQLQVGIARYTVTSTVFSNVIKEFAHALKGTASKIGCAKKLCLAQLSCSRRMRVTLPETPSRPSIAAIAALTFFSLV